MNTGQPEDTYPCEYINSDQKQEEQVSGINEKLKLMARQTIRIFNREHILKTLKFSYVAFFVTLVGAGLHMWLPPVLDYMTTYKDETLTVCEVVNFVRNQKANQTNEDRCMVEKDVTQFKIMFLINTSFLVFFVPTAALTTFVGGRLKTSLGRHVLKISILGESKLYSIFLKLIRFFLAFWYAIGAIFAIVIYFSDDYFLNVISLALITQVANYIGLISGICAEYYPSEINAMSVCVFMMLSRLGVAVGSNIVGPLLPLYCESMLFVGSGVICVAIVIVWFFPRGTNK